MPIAKKFAEQVICLPIYLDIDLENVERICKIIMKN